MMNVRTLALLTALAGSTLLGGAARAEDDPSLVDAVRLGDRAAVQALLDKHVNPDVALPDGSTALIWAAGRNDLAMTDLLLSAGADVKAANEYGATVRTARKRYLKFSLLHIHQAVTLYKSTSCMAFTLLRVDGKMHSA